MSNLLKNIDNSVEKFIINNVKDKLLYIPTFTILLFVTINIYSIYNIKKTIIEMAQ